MSDTEFARLRLWRRAKRYRERALDLRRLAQSAAASQSQHSLLNVADQWERLAVNVELRSVRQSNRIL